MWSGVCAVDLPVDRLSGPLYHLSNQMSLQTPQEHLLPQQTAELINYNDTSKKLQ